jgi:hypothetical protein
MTRNIIAAVLALILMTPLPVFPQMDADVDSILQAGEAFFKAMKQKEYAAIWNALSGKSKAAIVEDVTKRAARTYTKEQVETDFSIGGLIAKSYWDEYLSYFDPDMVLKESRWEMGPIGKAQAEVVLKHRKAEQPARLKMFREQNQWKVGLIETFGIERRDKARW